MKSLGCAYRSRTETYQRLSEAVALAFTHTNRTPSACIVQRTKVAQLTTMLFIITQCADASQ
jgi:hypothetical protein